MSRIAFVFVLLLAACHLLPTVPTPVMVVLPSLTPGPNITAPTVASGTPLPGGLLDVLTVMNGICFEAAWDAAGQVLVFRSAEDHIHFYELADNSRLCRRPVTRYPFDFSQGDVLAGLWSRGQGCVARHDVLRYERDDSAKTITVELDFSADGDCPYDLVRPFWVSIPAAQDYQIAIDVVDEG